MNWQLTYLPEAEKDFYEEVDMAGKPKKNRRDFLRSFQVKAFRLLYRSQNGD